jgi:hypothetical protein
MVLPLENYLVVRVLFCSIAPWIILFSNRVNSWLKDRKGKTISQQWIHLKAKNVLLLQCFCLRLLFLTIPKPLKQYPILKKDHSFRYPMRKLIDIVPFMEFALSFNDIGEVASLF